MPLGQETGWIYSPAPGAYMGSKLSNSVKLEYQIAVDRWHDGSRA